MTDRHGYQSDRRQFDWFDVNKNSLKRQEDTDWDTNTPFHRGRLKKALCFRIKTAGEHRSDVLSLSCFPHVVQLLSAVRMPSIHTEERHFPKSFHFRVVVCQHPVNTFSSELFPCGAFTKKTFCPVMLDWPLFCLTLFCLFVQLKVNSQSVCFLFFLIYPQRVDWAHKLCFSITLLYIYTVTHTPLLGAP